VKCDPFDKANNSAHTTPIDTATSFIAITSIFTHTTSATTAIQYGKYNKVVCDQGIGK